MAPKRTRGPALDPADFLPDAPRGETGPFSPQAFFTRPWKGSGIAQDPFGATVGAFRCQGRGRREGERLVLEQTVVFDNGFTQTAEWVIDSTSLHAFDAVDRLSGVRARGRRMGEAFRWTFKARAPTPFGVQTVRSDVLYTLRGPGQAMSVTKCSVFGVKLWTMTTYYSQV
jgi:hypothetical protein